MKPRDLPDRLARFLPRGGIGALTKDLEFISLWKWAKLSLVIGVVVGLAAAGVYYVLEWGEGMLLYRLGGLDQPRLHGDDHATRESVWWILVLLPAAGGLIAGLIIWRFAPETAGAGVDEVISAYHYKDARIRRRVPVVKLIASLFTLGSGGSAGREGPMAQIGAGFGSYIGTRFKLSARERRLLLLAGAAGGVSALFRTPLGAALWSLEILYREDFESEGLFPCLVSSVTAYSVFTTIYHQGSLFTVPVTYHFDPRQLAFYAVLGVACSILAVFWLELFNVSEKLWQRVKLPVWAKPAVGGLLLGLLAMGVPWVYAGGYGWMQDALRPVGDAARQLPVGYRGFGLLLGIAVAKMLATSFTVASGGSGGKFAPSLFIGGFAGGAFGLLFHELAPSIVPQPGAFVLVGMAAFYAGIAKAPIATIILVSELFGSYDLLVPLMFTEMITILALQRFTMHPAQVPSALHSPAHVADFTVDILEDLRVRDYYTEGRGARTVPMTMPLAEFLQHVSSTADSFFVVHDQQGRPIGLVSLDDVRSVVTDQQFLDVVLVGDAMGRLHSVSPYMDLRTALTAFLESGHEHLPVIDPAEPDRVLGLLSHQQIFAAYNAEIVRRRLGDGSAVAR